MIFDLALETKVTICSHLESVTANHLGHYYDAISGAIIMKCKFMNWPYFDDFDVLDGTKTHIFKIFNNLRCYLRFVVAMCDHVHDV